MADGDFLQFLTMDPGLCDRRRSAASAHFRSWPGRWTVWRWTPNCPLHLSRFFPRYRMADRFPTPVERVYHLADEARAYLAHVYTGNC